MASDTLRIRIEDEADYTATNDVAKRTDATIEVVTESGGGVEPELAPVVAVLIGLGALAAGQFVVDLIDQWRGGVVIDQRPDAKDDIYRDRALPRGFVLVKPKDGGDVKIEVKDAPKAMVERLLTELISGVFKSASSVAEAAKKALGDDKVQTA